MLPTKRIVSTKNKNHHLRTFGTIMLKDPKNHPHSGQKCIGSSTYQIIEKGTHKTLHRCSKQIVWFCIQEQPYRTMDPLTYWSWDPIMAWQFNDKSRLRLFCNSLGCSVTTHIFGETQVYLMYRSWHDNVDHLQSKSDYMTAPSKFWQFEFEGDLNHRVLIKNQALHVYLPLGINIINTTRLHNDLLRMIVPFTEQGVEKIEDDGKGKSVILSTI